MNSHNNIGLYKFINFTELNEFEINLVHKERNNLEVRVKMFDDKLIPLQEHLKFLENLKKDNTRKFILVKRANLYIGVYSLVKIGDGNAQGGFYLFKEARKKNLVIDFLYNTITYIFNNYLITNINGYALKDNKAANRINKFLGFRDSIPSKSNELYYYTEIQKHIWQTEILNNDNVIKLVTQTQKYYNNEI
jgi:UDP-4-amino-4,6-dideoxy-N-acetyl-beta-L-altrosamine N-acetyltransferase